MPGTIFYIVLLIQNIFYPVPSHGLSTIIILTWGFFALFWIEQIVAENKKENTFRPAKRSRCPWRDPKTGARTARPGSTCVIFAAAYTISPSQRNVDSVPIRLHSRLLDL